MFLCGVCVWQFCDCVCVSHSVFDNSVWCLCFTQCLWLFCICISYSVWQFCVCVSHSVCDNSVWWQRLIWNSFQDGLVAAGSPKTFALSLLFPNPTTYSSSLCDTPLQGGKLLGGDGLAKCQESWGNIGFVYNMGTLDVGLPHVWDRIFIQSFNLSGLLQISSFTIYAFGGKFCLRFHISSASIKP